MVCDDFTLLVAVCDKMKMGACDAEAALCVNGTAVDACHQPAALAKISGTLQEDLRA